MAIIDTGNGWYADEDWLRQSAGKMGEVTGSSADFAILPQSPAIRALTTDDFYVGTFGSQRHAHYYCVVTQTEPVYFAYGQIVNNRRYMFVASKEQARIFYGYPDGYAGNPQGNTLLNSYDASTGYYYNYVIAGDGPYEPYNTDCSQFNSLQECLGALGGIQFYKLNSGYAVSVITKWIDWQGQTQISPVLISDSANAVDLSLDGSTTISSALGTYAVDNKIFYMRVYMGGIDSGTISATGAHYIDLTASHGNTTLDMLFEYLKRASSLGVGDYSSVDPYTPEGTSITGGGDGTHTIISTPVPNPSLPTFSLSNAGFFSIWIPNEEAIRQLSAFMWTGNVTNLNFWKRMVTSPSELILGLSILPFIITPDGREDMALGYINTRIKMDYTTQQFFELDFGTLDVDEVWGAYLDYNPYTQIEIFLPYIGSRRLDTDEVMNKSLHLYYKVDIVSGACVAIIEADGTVLYHFIGNCSTQVPVTAEQMINIVRNTINLVTSVGSFIASGSGSDGSDTGSSIAKRASGAGIVSSALNLATTKQSAERAGSISSSAGLIGVQTPYLIVKRPRQALPEHQNTYTGYPSFITEVLGNLLGYTEVEIIHLHDIPCTDDELNEIEQLLMGGVIF